MRKQITWKQYQDKKKQERISDRASKTIFFVIAHSIIIINFFLLINYLKK